MNWRKRYTIPKKGDKIKPLHVCLGNYYPDKVYILKEAFSENKELGKIWATTNNNHIGIGEKEFTVIK